MTFDASRDMGRQIERSIRAITPDNPIGIAIVAQAATERECEVQGREDLYKRLRSEGHSPEEAFTVASGGNWRVRIEAYEEEEE